MTSRLKTLEAALEAASDEHDQAVQETADQLLQEFDQEKTAWKTEIAKYKDEIQILQESA